MDQNAPLTLQEFASLKEIGKGMAQRTIPLPHRMTLTSLGFIEQVLGALQVTNAGRVRVFQGK